jgi:predicted ATPase
MLCLSNEEKDHHYPVHMGSWVHHVVRADLQVAREMASRLLQTAYSPENTAMLAEAHFAMGCTLFHLGELAQSRKHFQEAMSGNESSDSPLQLTAFGPDLGVFSLSYLAQVLWLLGDADRSEDYRRQALARAERLAHPFTIALALDYVSMLHQFRNEPSPAAERAEECAVLCRQYGFSYYLAWTSIIRGWSLAEDGAAQEGVEQIQHGLTTLSKQGAGVRWPYYQTLLAQALGQAGDVETGLKRVSEALLVREKSGECWSDPMIHRVRAALLRKKGDVRGANLSQQRALLTDTR